MLRFIQTSPYLGDSTAWYAVDCTDTIRELIEEIKQRDDRFVDIHILKEGDEFFGHPSYKLDELPTEYLDCRIKSIEANGGWGMMSYYVRIESIPN